MLPSLDWDLDPVAIRLPPFPLQPVALGVGALGALSAFLAWRKSKREGILDKGGISFGVMIAVAGALVALKWADAHPTLELRYYSLLFVVVFLAGYALLNWQIRRGGGGTEDAGDFIVYGIIGVLAGARLGHVIFYDLERAMDDPIWIFKVWTGGLASHGATIALPLAMYWFTKARGIPFLEGADRFSFSIATGSVLVRIGNFCNSEIVGRKTDGSWGVRFPRYDHPPFEAASNWQAPLRHPTQLYEAALALLTLAVLFIADRAAGKEKRPRALLISLFFAVYFSGRLGLEFTKEYQVPALEGTFTMGQYLSLLPALLGWYGVAWSLKRRVPVGWAPEEPTDEGKQASKRQRKPPLHDPDVEDVLGHARRRRRRRKRRVSEPARSERKSNRVSEPAGKKRAQASDGAESGPDEDDED